ncbi:MAG: hypothetical protein AABZ60_22005 [Planctomycetota bacterium]
MKSYYAMAFVLFCGLALGGFGLIGCSKGGGTDPISSPQVDFLVFTEVEIENRTSDTTEPRQLNVDFSFRESELDIVSPLPIPGSF